MEIISQKLQEEYNEKVNVLIAHIQSCVENGTLEERAKNLQSKLDQLAKQYQKDEALGATRYKLYEAQAILYFFQQQDDKARRFIEESIQVRGGTYESAEKMLASLNRNQIEPVNLQPGRVPIGGWLFLFVLGLVIGAVIDIYYVVKDFGYLGDASLISKVPGFQGVAWFEIIVNAGAIIIIGNLIYLFIQNKRVARNVTIAFLVLAVIAPIVDHAWVTSVFASYPDSLTAINQDTTIGRNIFVALIWIPYFLISKRVRQTLTRA